MKTIKEIETKVEEIYEKYEINKELYNTKELIDAYKAGVYDGLIEEVEIGELLTLDEDRDDS